MLLNSLCHDSNFLFTQGRRECSQLTVKQAKLATEASCCVIALLYQSSAACHRSFSDVCIMLSVLLLSFVCDAPHHPRALSSIYLWFSSWNALLCCIWSSFKPYFLLCLGRDFIFSPPFFGVAAPIWPPVALLMLPRRVSDASPLSWMT